MGFFRDGLPDMACIGGTLSAIGCKNIINLVSMLLEWEEDSQWHRDQWEFPMRYFYRYELEHLVARAGLVLESMAGDFDDHPVGEDSKDFVLTCHTPK